jgi:hypothetical protein
MTPEQKIKHKILVGLISEPSNKIHVDPSTITEENLDDLYEELYADDIEFEFREGEVETNIPCEYSRHYESKSVAAKMLDGSWIGWTYWYGGGKHGEPESIDWMGGAYELDMAEEEKLVVVRTFTKK